ncbi:hypothetical protein [Nostoc sp.]|uniref:hypothetical protein n=1 Tax=Nostoc sp. TaxID=1180 RepID=UPI002FFC07B3
MIAFFRVRVRSHFFPPTLLSASLIPSRDRTSSQQVRSLPSHLVNKRAIAPPPSNSSPTKRSHFLH